MTSPPLIASPHESLDLLGVGIGPFNLSLAALADDMPDLRTAFLEQRSAFSWHPGLMIEGATLQVPFLADLVTLVAPDSRWSFLSYLRSMERLFPFYFAERFHIDRAEYDAYLRWCSASLTNCHFGCRLESVSWDAERELYAVDYCAAGTGTTGPAVARAYTRHLVLGIGTEPYVPPELEHLTDGARRARVLHAARYLDQRADLLAQRHVTVVGSGQSGAEVFLDLLRARPQGTEGLHWVSRSPAFAPMEYSKLGLEQFTPDYIRFFRNLPEATRDQLLPQQWQLYKAVSAETLAEIHDELYRRTLSGSWPDAVLRPATAVRSGQLLDDGRFELTLEHTQQGSTDLLRTDAVVLATGYRERPADGLLKGIEPLLRKDGSGRPLVDADHRLVCDDSLTGGVFVQNAERHTHGVGAPDLGLAAWRSAAILNAVAGRTIHPLPSRSAFTTFGSP
ncbi:lysine N(6)-hydroxylase/L-ornithine N(5)-oxygenase family protein [Streptomyces sp. NPDC048434]|uniref:lysine N(6)-hydroxylase/L-ornithine N(5)-oxygenase family protein n=1 Tax=Streptomyces sp. NPDC048434 TaxID=3365549 RepID=UPI003711649A